MKSHFPLPPAAAHPMSQSIKDEFKEIWGRFAKRLDSFYERAATQARRDHGLTLHEVFRSNRMVPKRHLQRILSSEEEENVNVGSATGLFFEQMAASLIEPVLRTEAPGVTVERNAATHHPELQRVAEQPDLLATSADGERAVVFEFKAAPKRDDLAAIRRQRKRYVEAGVPVRFYLVGGHVSYKKAELADYVEEGWATFLNASDANKSVLEKGPKLDDLAEAAARFIK